MRSKLLLAIGTCAWALGTGFGLKLIYDHEAGAGLPAQAPATWPAASHVARDAKLPELVMLAHPRCPCTRASIAELAVLMTRLKGRLHAHVLFSKPTAVNAPLPDQWDRARAIPGVSVELDDGGREAAHFGAKTSGQVVLYATDGRLLFAGGITASRGHQGDNVGLERIVSLVTGSGARASSAVFGCPLQEEDSR